MLQISNVKIYELEESVIACRNAMRTELPEYTKEEFEKSLKRAITLASTPSNSGHATFLTGIRVAFDIVYPNYISPELQRYHWIDIVTSSSKMHRLLQMDLDMSCNEYVTEESIAEMRKHINRYNEISKDSAIGTWKFELRNGVTKIATTKSEALYYAFMMCISNCVQGIELFMRVNTNYMQLKNIYAQRKHHKLKEDWGAFCKMVESLPYFHEFIEPKFDKCL